MFSMMEFFMSKTRVRLRADLDGLSDLVSEETATVNDEPSLTKQSFKDECDPNFVMEIFARTGDASILEKSNPRYGDFTGVNDYHSARNIVIAAEEAFASLPASLRTKFQNDPARYVAFVSDPTNRREMFELGLLREGLSPDSVRAPQSEREESGGNPAGKGEKPSSKAKKPPVIEDAEE